MEDLRTLTLPGKESDRTKDGAERGGRLQVGSRLAEYIVDGILGEGGMGVVYKARDPDLGRSLAIKVLHPSGMSGSSNSKERLIKEAQSMARLCHPNVVTVYHIGNFQGQVFIAMEHVDGGTLRDWGLAQKRRVDEVLQVWSQAGRGLWAAHQAGLVHRDFKPDNVLIGGDGRVRVTDFGLVSGCNSMVDESVMSNVPLEMSLTAEGAVLGTPAYMAPEQHEAAATDARTDQFSFCVSLYEALYGCRPFAGENYPALVFSVLMGELRVPPQDSAVPDYLYRLLARGLSADPAKRYPSMEELLGAMGASDAAESDEENRNRVDDVVRGRVRELKILQGSGRLRQGESIMDEIRQLVVETDDDELTARFTLSSAAVYSGLFQIDDASSCLDLCIPAAGRAGCPEIEAEALSRRLGMEKDVAVAQMLSTVAKSAVSRANSAEQDARYAIAQGLFSILRDNPDNAREEINRALEIWHRELRDDDRLVDVAVLSYALLGQLSADGGTWYDQALQVGLAAAYEHPVMAAIYCNVARASEAPESSLLLHQEAMRIYIRAFGEWDQRVAMVLCNTGSDMVKAGSIEGGISMLKRGLAMGEQILGENHLQVATALLQLGQAMVPAQIAGAHHCILRCIEIRHEQDPEDLESLANAHNCLGIAFGAMGEGWEQYSYGHYEESAKLYAILKQALSEAMVHQNLAFLCAYSNNAPLAIKHAELVVELAPKNYQVTFMLAELLWAKGTQKARSLALAQSASGLAGAAEDTELSGRIDVWRKGKNLE